MISFRATAIGFASAATCLMTLAVSAQQLDAPIELREEANAEGAGAERRPCRHARG